MLHSAPTGSATVSQVPSALHVPGARQGSSSTQEVPTASCVDVHPPVELSQAPTKHGPDSQCLGPPTQELAEHTPSVQPSAQFSPPWAGLLTQPPAAATHTPSVQVEPG